MFASLLISSSLKRRDGEDHNAIQYLHRLNAIAGLIWVLLLLSSVFAPTALAERYVLNQTPDIATPQPLGHFKSWD